MGMAVKVKENICWSCGKESLKKMKSDIQYWWLCGCGATTVPLVEKKTSKGALIKVIGAYDRTKGKQVRG